MAEATRILSYFRKQLYLLQIAQVIVAFLYAWSNETLHTCGAGLSDLQQYGSVPQFRLTARRTLPTYTKPGCVVCVEDSRMYGYIHVYSEGILHS
jgi:hypothetical protein